MQNFLIRFILFLGLWGIIIFQKETFQVTSILFLAASLICFFFLSKPQVSVSVYGLLLICISVHGFVIGEFLYSALLLLLIAMIACIRLFGLAYYMLLAIAFICVLGLAWNSGVALVPVLILTSIFTYLLIYQVKSNQVHKEHQAMYEQLLAEYRQLKRIHMTTEKVARTEERTRIAREIHDSVGHRLTALMMKIEMLHIEKPDERLKDLKVMAYESLEETREAVQALQTTETTGISAIVQLIRKLEAESQLLIEFTLKEGVLSVPLSNEQGIVLYRVIQEALTNVMRHSISKQVHIMIGKSALDTLAFTVKNPLPTKAHFVTGFGIKHMHARVTEHGGKLDVYQTEKQFIVDGMMPYKRKVNNHVAHIDC